MLKTVFLSLLPLSTLLVAGCCEEPEEQTPEETCAIVCERVVGCTAQEFAPDGEMPGDCEWVDAAAMTTTCVDACLVTAMSPAAAQCLECVSTNFACSGTAAFRPCDGVCEGTPLVTGTDFEGVPEYGYEQWFFEDYSDPSLWVCM